MGWEPHHSLANKKQASAATSGANQTTAITLASKPANRQAITAFLNGMELEVGDGVKTKDFYFSRDTGTTALKLGAVIVGDTLYWTKARELYNLAVTDLISLHYATFGV